MNDFQDVINQVQTGKEELQQKYNELKQAYTDWKSAKNNPDGDQVAESKTFKEMFKSFVAELKDAVNHAPAVIKNIANAIGKFPEIVKKIINTELTSMNTSFANLKSLFVWNSDENNAKKDIDTDESQIDFGDSNIEKCGEVVSIEEYNNLALSDAEVDILKKDPKTLKLMQLYDNYYTTMDQMVVLAFYMTAYQSLLQPDELLVTANEFIKQLKVDITTLSESFVNDVLDGKNPDFEKQVKDLLTVKIGTLKDKYLINGQ